MPRTVTDGTNRRRRSRISPRAKRADRLWAAIDALPDKLRVVVVLSNIEGHGIRDVARLLDLPDGTVKSRLFLARQRLKEQLQWMLSGPAGR
jgi:RNA polymerase sigma-70 factor (ECF subfamily)